MSYGNINDIIRLEISSGLKDVVEKCWIKASTLHIEIRKPNGIVMVIATIKQNYSAFRSDIKKLLKEKQVQDDDCTMILNFIDANYKIIFPDYNPGQARAKQKEHENHRISDKDESDQYDQYDQAKIKIVNVLDCLKLDSGTVKVSGNIVGRSESFKVISTIETSCACNKELQIRQFNPPKFRVKEFTCPKCHVKFNINNNNTLYRNAIKIQLQDSEKYDEFDGLTCILLDTGIENIKVGEKVSVTGDIYIKPKFNKELLLPVVYSEQVEYEERNEITLNEIDTDANRRFVKLKGSNNVIKALADMFDSTIIGNKIAKEALLYSLVNTGDDSEDIRKFKKRNRINVLLVGDPGHAKSSLIKKAISMISNSRYESIQHSSPKSLTAIVVKENEQPFLRYGPIPMSRGSICGLNEIGAMKPEDQIHLYDIMEEGEFTINKLGLNAKIKSPTTIIATTNLMSNSYTGQYIISDSNPDKISLNQIPLESALLDRIDLIVILKENGDINELREYARKKTELQSTVAPNYDKFLQKYIEFARKLNPTFSPEALKMIQDYYVNLNKVNRNLKSKRLLETIFRICKAVSKLRLKQVIDGEDVLHATKFYNILINKYFDSVAFIPKDPTNLVIEECKKILKSKEIGDSVILADLVKQVCLDNEQCSLYLFGFALLKTEVIRNELFALTHNKKLRKIKELLLNDKNIIAVSKCPIRLSYLSKSEFPVESYRSYRSYSCDDRTTIKGNESNKNQLSFEFVNPDSNEAVK